MQKYEKGYVSQTHELSISGWSLQEMLSMGLWWNTFPLRELGVQFEHTLFPLVTNFGFAFNEFIPLFNNLVIFSQHTHSYFLITWPLF